MKKLMNCLKRAKSNEQGAAVVIVAVSMTVLLAFAGAAVDFGMVYLNTSQLQTALDAGVMAGAARLPDTVLAESTAKEYIEKNGVPAQDIQISFGDNNSVISAESEKAMGATFLKIIGIDVMPYAAAASAQRAVETLGGPFDYKIFSGDPDYTLTLGGNFNIAGSVHSNGSLNANPAKGNITGTAQACKNVNINTYTTTVGHTEAGVGKINMVDFSNVVSENMPGSYGIVWDASYVNAQWTKQYWNGNIKITGNTHVSNQVVINGNVYIDGNLTINGGAPVCVLNGNLYVNGTIEFNNTTVVNGCVFAKNNIYFKGGGLSLNTTSTVCVYSQQGSIDISTASSEVRGMIYAPNGTVQIAGGTTTFYGSIIGNRVSGIPANLLMKDPDVTLPFIHSSYKIRLVR